MDVRADYFLAVEAFETVMMSVRDDQWEAQSPCESWKAVDVVGHLVGSLHMVSSLATTGEREMPFSEWPTRGCSPATIREARSSRLRGDGAEPDAENRRRSWTPRPV